MLSKQPKQLENYTFVVIFADKIFKDPERKRKIKRIIKISITIIVVLLIISLIFYMFYKRRIKRIETLNLTYQNTIEYIQDNNYIRAKEECNKSIEVANKLNNKEKGKDLNNYLKLIETTILADEALKSENYKEAQENYMNAKDRARYADNVNEEYVDKKLEETKNYLNVYDYINLGDKLKETGDY